MNILVLHTSPNHDGLTAVCAQAAADGAREELARQNLGADSTGAVDLICINDLALRQCQACDNGWGTCRSAHECQLIDDFQVLHARILQADALVLVTPVYWGEMSESAKALTDRLRRCEATRREETPLAGRPLIAVAAAGGSGNGTITCLGGLERWGQHTGMRVFDLIPVNRWNKEYKLAAIHAAARCMVTNCASTSG